MSSGKILKLHDNIQFIYELALAKLELQSFDNKVEITNNLREFKLVNPKNTRLLKKRLAYFKTVDGDFTDYHFIQQYNQTRSVNQYLTHWFYPYKGKFHPQMIRALINIIGVKEGDTILDPFVGSGTAILESQLLGINSIGIDISPLCVLISKVKTQSLELIDEILKTQRRSSSKFNTLVDPHGQGSFFESFQIDEIKNQKVQNFFRLAEMIARSDFSRRRRNFDTSFNFNINRMLESIQGFKQLTDKLDLKLGESKIIKGDARNFKLDKKVQGIITSPPYSIALNYVMNDAHSLKAMGYNLDKIKEEFIGVRGSGFNRFQLYSDDMLIAYRKMYEVLEKGRYCVVVIGNVTFQNTEIDTTSQVVKQCESIGFKLLKKIDKIIFGLYNVMQKEYILIFQKP